MQQIFSWMACAFALLGFFPYGRHILKNGAKPAKATWLIWASLDSITFYGMYLEKSLNGQIVGAVLGVWVIVFLAMKYGKTGWTALDAFCLVGALIGITLIFVHPSWALLVSLGTIFLGSFPTFVATWKDPNGESSAAWVIWELSCFCSMLGLPKWTIEDAAQPIAFLTVETIMISLIFLRPIKQSLKRRLS